MRTCSRCHDPERGNPDLLDGRSSPPGWGLEGGTPGGTDGAGRPLRRRRPRGSGRLGLEHVKVPFGVQPVLPLLVEDDL